MEKQDFSEILSYLSKEIGIDIKENNTHNFYNYMNLLIEWNKNINLTAITEPKDIILKHFIDSLTINSYISDTDKVILDIGTGAGFPGLPIKIVNSEKKVILVDSLQKRINFLEEVVRKLELKNVLCIHSRAEELARNKEYRQQGDVVVSRAVARLNVLIEYILPFVRIGGKCICMKGPNIEDELNEANKAIELLGGRIVKVEELTLPESDVQRTIIVVEKIKDTSSKYPRKAGTPSKQPII